MGLTSKRNLRPPPRSPLSKLGGQDYALTTVQRNVEKATARARAMPQTKGRLVEVSVPGAGNVTYSHGLGRRPVRRDVEHQSGSAITYVGFVSNNSRTETLQFSGGPGTVSIWVY